MLQTLLGDGSEPFHTFVHIGAGEGETLNVERDRLAGRLVLVEPHPARAERLRTRLGGNEGVRVIEAAVADQDGLTELQLFNLSRMDSLHAPTGARELFRGLKPAGAVAVRALRPETLLDQVGPLDGGPNLLVIDLPADALFILDALDRDGRLAEFDTVVVQTSNLPLHEGGGALGDLQSWAAEHAYQLIYDPEPSDPDILHVTLEPNQGARTAREAREKPVRGPAEFGRKAAEEAAAPRPLLSWAEAAAGVTRGDQDAVRAELVMTIARLAAAKTAAETHAVERDEARLELKRNQAEITALQYGLAAAGRDLQAAIAEIHANRKLIDAAQTELHAARAETVPSQGVMADLRSALDAAQADAAGAEAARAALLEDLASSHAELRELRTSSAARAALAETERHAVRAELAKAAAEVAALRDSQSAAQAALVAKQTELEQAREALAAARTAPGDVVLGALNEARAALERLRAEHAGLMETLAGERAAGAAARAEQEARARQGAANQAVTVPGNGPKEPAAISDPRATELAEVREDLRIALRMQRMAQADLQHLQERYETLQAKKSSADDLLAEITRRLLQASRQLPAPAGDGEPTTHVTQVTTPETGKRVTPARRRR